MTAQRCRKDKTNRMNKHKLLRKILNVPQNVKFNEMLALVTAFGFVLTRINGSHHIFTHPVFPNWSTCKMSVGRPNLIKSGSFSS